VVSSSGVEMPKNEHGHFDPWKWVTLCLEMSRTSHPVTVLHPIKMKILNVDLLDFQTAVLKQVSVPISPLHLSIMTNIFFFVLIQYFRQCPSFISVPTRCAVCAYDYVNAEHIPGFHIFYSSN